MTPTPLEKEFEIYMAANLNDGEYPIPESGRMVNLKDAVDVAVDFIREHYE